MLLIISTLLVSCGSGDGPSLENPSGGSGGGTDPVAPGEEVLRIGSGSGADFIESILGASQTMLNAGDSSTIQVNVVNQSGNPPTSEANVSFSSVCASSALASFDDPISATPGLTTVVYTTNGCSGDDIITAVLSSTGETAVITLSIQPPEVLSVTFVSSSVPQLSLAGLGGQVSTELTFSVTGPQGVPIIGDSVSFSISSTVGGASILAGRETAVTDNNGLVRTILNSGTVAGPVNVLAEHDATSIQGISNDITISSGVPYASRFSLSYDNFNPATAFDVDGVSVSLNIIASDQFGNDPTDGTRISFVSPEAGQVDNSCELVDGACSVTWISTGTRPDNMRVEVIAYTDGAEDFVDNNGNSVFDGSDGAINDLGEPYTDEDESGAYDLGEFFFDTNQNGVRDGGNSLWDGPCLSLVDASAICTGEPSMTIAQTVTIVMSDDGVRYLSLGTFPTPGTAINLVQGTSVSMDGIILADGNAFADALGSNPLPFGTSIKFAIEGGGATLQGLTPVPVGNTTSPTGPYGTTVVAATVAGGSPLPAGVRLVLNIGAGTQFAWPLNITF